MLNDIDSFVLTMADRENYFKLTLEDINQLGLKPNILRGYEGRLSEGNKAGILTCTKKYFLWLDDDDRYPNLGALEELYRLMENSNAPFAYSSEITMDENGKLLDKVNYIKYNYRLHSYFPIVVHGLILVRRDLVTDDMLNNCLYKKAYWQCLLLKLAHNSPMPLSTEIVGRYWRQHPNQNHNK